MSDVVAVAVDAIIANPLADGDGASDVEKAAHVDSNAQPSVFPRLPRVIGRWLATEEGSPSRAYRFAQFSVLFTAAMHGLDYGAKGDAEFVRLEWDELSSGCQTLIYVSVLGQCVGLVGGLLPLHAVLLALPPGGKLEQLGAGTVKIAASDARALRLWSIVMAVPTVLAPCVATLGLVVSLTKATTGQMPSVFARVGGATNPDALSTQYTISQGLLIFQIVPVVACFWVSMMTASALARDALIEVQHAVINSDPRDKASWDRDVATPALDLDKTMRLLSRGWGAGLFGMSIFCWGMAVNSFCRGINTEYSFHSDFLKDQPQGTERLKFLQISVVMMLMPLLLTLEVAVCYPCLILYVVYMSDVFYAFCCYAAGYNMVSIMELRKSAAGAMF